MRAVAELAWISAITAAIVLYSNPQEMTKGVE